MRVKSLQYAVALMAAMLVVPAASAQSEPEEIPLVPTLDESTPGGATVPETCDPLGLILCAGPINEAMPVSVAVSSDGMSLLVWTHEGESEPAGPFYQNQTVPVTGTHVPITFCPNTCPVPVAPEAAFSGSVIVCVEDASGVQCREVGAPGWAVTDLLVPEDSDGDGIDDRLEDPAGNGNGLLSDPNDPYDPVFWERPCPEGRTEKVVDACRTDDGYLRIQTPTGGLLFLPFV